MKVLLLGFGKISYMPYMHFYLEHILDNEVHLLYWDRDGKEDSLIPKGIDYSYKYKGYIEEHLSVLKKFCWVLFGF